MTAPCRSTRRCRASRACTTSIRSPPRRTASPSSSRTAPTASARPASRSTPSASLPSSSPTSPTCVPFLVVTVSNPTGALTPRASRRAEHGPERARDRGLEEARWAPHPLSRGGGRRREDAQEPAPDPEVRARPPPSLPSPPPSLPLLLLIDYTSTTPRRHLDNASTTPRRRLDDASTTPC